MDPHSEQRRTPYIHKSVIRSVYMGRAYIGGLYPGKNGKNVEDDDGESLVLDAEKKQ